jgi:hypothetical protein
MEVFSEDPGPDTMAREEDPGVPRVAADAIPADDQDFTTTVRLNKAASRRLKELGRAHQRKGLSANLRWLTDQYIAKHDAEQAEAEAA